VVFGAGAEAEDKAGAIQQTLRQQGLRCWVTGAGKTLDETGAIRTLTSRGVFERVRALLLNASIDALVMMIEDDSLLASGLPVDRITELIEVSGVGQDGRGTAREGAWRRLSALIHSYARYESSRHSVAPSTLLTSPNP
jgi:hypothetical protein